MKNLIYSLLTAALCLSVNSASAAEQGKPVTNYKEIQLPELNSMQVQKPERYVMENGMTVYLLEDHEVPLVNLSLRIYTGSRWEPADKAGLAEIVGEVMRTGGSEKFPGDKLDDELDNSATSIEIGIGRNEGSASINSLKHNFAHSLEILTDLLQNPSFPEEKIALCKQEIAGGIVRRNDDASGICSREFNRLLRGKDSPYGHQVELTTLANISREDMIQFHQQYFQPQNMILGVWGDFSSAEMKKQLAETLGQWKKGTAARPAVPGIDMKAAGTTGVYLVEKTDIEQSFIRMGHIGGLQSDPDYYALILLNDILGGGFSSRLFCHIRTDKGLAYHVGSSWSAGMDIPGTFVVSGSTKLASTSEFIRAAREEVERVIKEGVTEEELQRSKDTFLNGFVFEFDSTGKIVSRLMAYEYYGYPADTLEHFQENIEKVTCADILAAAKKHLKPQNMLILVVGNPEKFDKPLTEFGKVTPLDITIPGMR